MMLSQCIGHEDFCERGAAQLGLLMVLCDAQLVVLVEHVALALDERGFGRGAAQIAIPHVACDLEASCRHIVPLKLALPVDPRTNGAHFVQSLNRCVFEKHGTDVVIQQRETCLLRSTLHIVVQLHKTLAVAEERPVGG